MGLEVIQMAYDAARAQELKNSIAEGKLLLRTTTAKSRRIARYESLEAWRSVVRRAVENSREKLVSLGK
jgi:hypothetical protein